MKPVNQFQKVKVVLVLHFKILYLQWIKLKKAKLT